MPIYIGFLDVFGCLGGAQVVPRVSRFPGYPSQPECPKMFLNALKASIFCKNKF